MHNRKKTHFQLFPILSLNLSTNEKKTSKLFKNKNYGSDIFQYFSKMIAVDFFGKIITVMMINNKVTQRLLREKSEEKSVYIINYHTIVIKINVSISYISYRLTNFKLT